MTRLLTIVAIIMLSVPATIAADPMATAYTARQCEGSLTPYPLEVQQVNCPDSLMPVYINHVGRHGSRYPAGAQHCLALRRVLGRADSLGTITPLGRRLMELTDYAIEQSTDRWGALDSLGMAEQRAIATRMYYNFAEIFADGATVNALSSYSPRAMLSMYTFLHQLDRMDNKINFNTSTGRVNSPLVRPFDVNDDYRKFRRDTAWAAVYTAYFEANCPTAPIARVLGQKYPFGSADVRRDLAITEYYVLAGMSAMSVSVDLLQYFTAPELNALWSCFNLRQYLQRTATTLSTVPADIAGPLLQNIVDTFDSFVAGRNPAVADLRFGHGETMMPLLSLLRLPGCYYMTNYFDTVALHWRDFEVVPMSANLQMIMFRSRTTGRYYVRTDLNERPVTLIPGNDELYVPWATARDYLMHCMPLY